MRQLRLRFNGKTGGSCGLPIKKPGSFLRHLADKADLTLSTLCASGIVFLSQNASLTEAGRNALVAALRDAGIEVAGWRDVPVDRTACGAEALKTLPDI